jgi:hypothetical protein
MQTPYQRGITVARRPIFEVVFMNLAMNNFAATLSVILVAIFITAFALGRIICFFHEMGSGG